MRTAAIIQDGVVANVIVIADGDEGDLTLKELGNAHEITGTDVRISDLFDGEKFTRVYSEQELSNMKALDEYISRRKQVLEKLGLTEEEISLLIGA